MSTQLPPPSATTSPEEVEIKIVSHSNVFYWWPVWAIGFLMALLTWIDNHRMVVVPADAEVISKATIEVEEKPGETTSIKGRDAVVLPEGHHLPSTQPRTEARKTPLRHIANSKTYGVIYALTLLLVILITNVPLRGMWSLVIIITLVLLAVIFALAGWWERIFEVFSLLDIRINMGGYLFISTFLFGVWLITLLFFDRQIYVIFTPGQVKVRTEIGGGEKAYDTTGMTIEKQRSDLFRHWILGLGSGDLIVNTAGAHVHQFDLPNVLFIGSKVKLIQDMLREKAVVKGR